MKFEFMEDAANELCDELENNPNRFTETTYCLVDNRTGIEYWIGSGSRNCITDTWNGRSSNRVFSSDQGERIAASFKVMREIKASAAQERVLRASRPMNKNVSDAMFTLRQRIKNWLGGGPRIDI